MRMIVCADNDRLTAGNAGLTHAMAAAIAIGGSLVVPVFPSDIGTDFNDMVAICGKKSVLEILKAAQTPPPAATVKEVIQKYELRPYQHNAIAEIRRNIDAGKNRIMVSSPTGSGKGVMLSHIINLCHIKGSSVLFLVHREEILFQVSRYLEHHGIEHGIIKAGVKHQDRHSVQLASFQTIHRRMENPYIRKADVIIIDEAHHATAKTYLEVTNFYSKPETIVLGFSATPSRQSGEGLGNFFDSMVQVATIKQLTDEGYLAPVRVFAPTKPDLKGVKLTAGDYNKKTLETAMNKASLVGDIVGHYQKYGENRKSVVFATGVKHSLAICSQFHAAGIAAAHVDGKTKKEERESILARFKAGMIQIIVNCYVYTEGVDVPDIGCVILARPTKSLPMYLQMVGRGMRTITGKTDCILLDHAGAVFEHGFPDEVETWELSTTRKTVNAKQEQRKQKESEPICCPACTYIYTKQLQCPNCGNIPTAKQIGKDIDYIDGVLGEVVRKSKNKAKEPKVDAASWYQQLLRFAIDRGYREGWTYYTFKDRFRVSPARKFRHLPPASEVSPEVKNWIQHRQIKQAKAPVLKVGGHHE